MVPQQTMEDQIVVPLTRATTEMSAASPESFETAINEGVVRVTSTLRNVESVRIKDMNVLIENGNIVGYKVNLAVTFMLESDTPDELEGGELHRSTRRDPKYDSRAEFLGQHVLLKNLTEEEIQASKRFLYVTPAKTGSGLKDVSVNHDRYLAED
jgi:flavin-binding protein dodecin